jgi:hypothetical protein
MEMLSSSKVFYPRLAQRYHHLGHLLKSKCQGDDCTDNQNGLPSRTFNFPASQHVALDRSEGIIRRLGLRSAIRHHQCPRL